MLILGLTHLHMQGFSCLLARSSMPAFALSYIYSGYGYNCDMTMAMTRL